MEGKHENFRARVFGGMKIPWKSIGRVIFFLDEACEVQISLLNGIGRADNLCDTDAFRILNLIFNIICVELGGEQRPFYYEFVRL